jgi:hypothetical protein
MATLSLEKGIQVFGCSGIQEGTVFVGPEHLNT